MPEISRNSLFACRSEFPGPATRGCPPGAPSAVPASSEGVTRGFSYLTRCLYSMSLVRMW